MRDPKVPAQVRTADTPIYVANQDGSKKTLEQATIPTPSGAVQGEKTVHAEHTPARVQLSAQAWKDLAFAVDVGYEVRVLKKQISESKWQVVVLFGEKHTDNTDIELEAAEKVIQHFSSFALEGLDPEKFVGGRSYSAERESLMQEICAHSGRNNKGSINLTIERELKLSTLMCDICKELVKQLSAKRSEERSDPVSVKPEDFGVSRELFSEALKLLNDHLASREEEECVKQPKSGISIQYLEDKHRPDWVQHFRFINQAFGRGFLRVMNGERVRKTVLAATGSCLLASIIGSFVPTTPGALVQTVCEMVALAYWSTLVAILAFKSTGAHSLASRIEAMVDRHHHNRREVTMTSAIDNIAVVEEPHRPLLAQMGRDHVEPIATRLQKEFGWMLTTGPYVEG